MKPIPGQMSQTNPAPHAAAGAPTGEVHTLTVGDPPAISAKEPVKRAFALFTGGMQPDIDLLGIVVECFGDMNDIQIKAALGYLNARYLK